MEDKITHDGVVESIEGNHIVVKIVQTSACSACKAKSLCTSAESKEKLVDVWDDRHAATLQQGDRVVVCAAQSTGMRAVVLSFVMPLILLIVSVLLNRCGLSEVQSALIAIVVIALYYFILSRFKTKLNREFAFWIESD